MSKVLEGGESGQQPPVFVYGPCKGFGLELVAEDEGFTWGLGGQDLDIFNGGAGKLCTQAFLDFELLLLHREFGKIFSQLSSHEAGINFFSLAGEVSLSIQLEVECSEAGGGGGVGQANDLEGFVHLRQDISCLAVRIFRQGGEGEEACRSIQPEGGVVFKVDSEAPIAEVIGWGEQHGFGV